MKYNISFITLNNSCHLINETQKDKKLSRADDCLAIRGKSHATLKNDNNQKIMSNLVPFFIS